MDPQKFNRPALLRNAGLCFVTQNQYPNQNSRRVLKTKALGGKPPLKPE